MRTHKAIVTAFLLILMIVILGLNYIWANAYLWLSFGLVLLAIVLFLFRFETRKVEPRELVLLAVMASIAAVGRIPFASLPSVQPTTFVIMMSGYVFGAESGFVIGAVAALASNMIMGQGPWTPWQMVAWGLVGLTAGLLRNTLFMKRRWGQIVFGVLWGYLFGWIMNLWGFIAMIQSGGSETWKAFILYMIGSATFDTFHAISNVFFLVVFGGIWIKILSRFKRKYGLLE
ncbi:energy-coupling factor transport system substrate-specific component [Neobacillus bataviensis]|uniref:Energy-coupling factor transport system substrate-specific component n=1 Tax=Neobacillus bataviensis TaxID=220685 RepID=A0A561DY95_9BACI|nr:ECF transporter S component [Neobacillus bataviensis]TWE08339.1 energy-coupling factor transport system substrate-specific component [Neobacillus bataviensis]